MMKTLLVSAGEPSGDRISAMVLHALSARNAEWRAFGMGGGGCAQVGMDVVVPLADVAAMGLLPVVQRGRSLWRAFGTLRTEARRRHASLALLVGFTSFHQALGSRLRAEGTQVLWCVAPQVWAWRASRLRTLRHSIDKLAVLLPFEEEIWRNHAYDVRYVGHPAAELTSVVNAESRQGKRKCLAVLMGSRVQEVRATAGPFIEAARIWQTKNRNWDVQAVLSPALPSPCEHWLRHEIDKAGVELVVADPLFGAAPRLSNYDLAMCASGTACLEAALAGVPPVIGYRCDRVSALLAKMLLRTAHIGLPNIVLGRRAFPELLQGDLTPQTIVQALAMLHASNDAHRACARVRAMMLLDDGMSFGERIVEMLLTMRGAI